MDYNETIYINGDTVTIVNNFDTTSYPVREFNGKGKEKEALNLSKFNSSVDEKNQTTYIQFNVSDFNLGLMTSPGKPSEDFTIYLCGYLDGSKNHVDTEITFRVEKIFKSDKTGYDIIVYPIKSSYSHDYTIKLYYFVEYDSVFSDKAVYPDLKQELLNNTVIYSYDQGRLRSIYWYDADAEELEFLKSPVSLNDYESEFILNLSDLQEFDLNSIFICSEHDKFKISTYTGKKIKSNDLIATGTSYSACKTDFDWAVSIGDSEKKASNYLQTYNDLYPAANPEDIMEYSHFISFNSSALNNDLLNERNLSVQFYPVVTLKDEVDTEAVSEVVSEDDTEISFKDKAYAFTFKRLSQSVSTEIDDDGVLDLVDEETEIKKPLLSAMIFPTILQEKLEDNSLVLATLNTDVFDGIEDSSDLLTPETNILSVMDIGFESNSAEINDLLKENNQMVTLTFSIPTVIDGSNIDLNRLEVLHVIEVDGEKTVEQLTIDLVEDGKINGVNCYNITTSTSGFSPFAVVLSKPVKPPETTQNSGGQSFGEAVVVPPKESVKDEKNGFGNTITTPVTVIEDIITTVQGHLSVFSILVVLTSGLFMWTYIRRRI
ncbi:hypothetical protein [Methanimicrococcus blatticola]|uniref:hypothetical protein n=1 Tax=Methanimicrococcus blatticola TaxID=91560 RepID=UPI0010620FFF|nr:hypothetical protein [Methanimicrococcus blatticola]MBZ3934967.1 hypothetical protein [Methanimicrococcus blatticola]MCC2508934.1 hypothetical protein [Methanimicrococcus blatticola]